MRNQTEDEEKIRQFMFEELKKDWANSIDINEIFELDSLDQVELRVFLEDTFQVKVAPGQKPFNTISIIFEFLASPSSSNLAISENVSKS